MSAKPNTFAGVDTRALAAHAGTVADFAREFKAWMMFNQRFEDALRAEMLAQYVEECARRMWELEERRRSQLFASVNVKSPELGKGGMTS